MRPIRQHTSNTSASTTSAASYRVTGRTERGKSRSCGMRIFTQVYSISNPCWNYVSGIDGTQSIILDLYEGTATDMQFQTISVITAPGSGKNATVLCDPNALATGEQVYTVTRNDVYCSSTFRIPLGSNVPTDPSVPPPSQLPKVQGMGVRMLHSEVILGLFGRS